MKIVNPTLLDDAVKRMVAALRPEVIYLYGSHAYGHPHPHSDVDFLIIVPDSNLALHKRAIEAYRSLRGLFCRQKLKWSPGLNLNDEANG